MSHGHGIYTNQNGIQWSTVGSKLINYKIIKIESERSWGYDHLMSLKICTQIRSIRHFQFSTFFLIAMISCGLHKECAQSSHEWSSKVILRFILSPSKFNHFSVIEFNPLWVEVELQNWWLWMPLKVLYEACPQTISLTLAFKVKSSCLAHVYFGSRSTITAFWCFRLKWLHSIDFHFHFHFRPRKIIRSPRGMWLTIRSLLSFDKDSNSAVD